MSSVAVIVSSYGDWKWAQLALSRAVPSAVIAAPDELIIKHDADGDNSSVRNAAAWSANSKWLCFLDADDVLDQAYVEAMRPFLHEHDLLLAPYVQTVNQSGVTTPAQIPNAGNWPNTNDAVVGTLIERERFLRLGGFDKRFWPWTDWELWLRACKDGATKIHVAGAVYVVHDRPGSENKRLTAQQGQALHARIKGMHRQVWQEQAIRR